MTNGNSDRKKLAKLAASVIGLVLAIVLGVNLFDNTLGNSTPTSTENSATSVSTENDTISTSTEMSDNESDMSESTADEDKEELMLYMFDVGQGDSFLLVQDGQTALIDCGTRETGKDVVEYLNQLGISKIDYLFGTHPHEDHMGGMYDVITNFDIGKIILPEVKSGEVSTNWYIKLMTMIKTQGYELETATYGMTYNLGDASINIIGPICTPQDGNLNNYSTVLKVSFGEMDIIMTGDAEEEVENTILANGDDIDAEILKVGHHGSNTSTSEFFLESVSPDYALISAELGNSYKHPTKTTMEKLQESNVEVYRTDENGTVIATITSDDVRFNSEPGDYLSGTERKEREKQ